jgi:hypothetical protein
MKKEITEGRASESKENLLNNALNSERNPELINMRLESSCSPEEKKETEEKKKAEAITITSKAGVKNVLTKKLIELSSHTNYLLQRRRGYRYQDNQTGILDNSIVLLYSIPAFARTPITFLISYTQTHNPNLPYLIMHHILECTLFSITRVWVLN